MLTSLKRPVIAITAIVAVGAPSVASARFFDYGGTSPVPMSRSGPSHRLGIRSQVDHHRPGNQRRPRQLTAQQVNAATGAGGYNRARGLHASGRTHEQRSYVLGIASLTPLQLWAAFGTTPTPPSGAR